MNGYNKIDYAVNIVEAYRHAKGLSGEEVAKLFGDAGVFKFLEDFGDTLHCQSDEATIAEIDDFITGMECHGVREHALPQETGKCVIATHSAGGSC